MNSSGAIWLDVIADLFINLSAGWFAVVFVEPQVYPFKTTLDLLILTFKFILGIFSLVLAKKLKEVVKRYGF